MARKNTLILIAKNLNRLKLEEILEKKLESIWERKM